ncbi:hypothetical protein BH23CHL5_BH23CHL5_28410 [soil metagenome]
MNVVGQNARRFLALSMSLALIMAFSVAFGSVTAVADDNPDGSHPAHLHTGTCDTPGDVVFPLSNVSNQFLVDGTPSAGTEMMGAGSAIPVKVSITNVQATLADIVAGGHTLLVHESDENIANYIACGDVGGAMIEDTGLPFGLGELNDSDYFGSAWLNDNGDGTTSVAVVIMHSDLVEEGDDMGGMDHSNDDMAGDMAGSTEVVIEGFAFAPDTIEISVGDTLTWTNNDSAPHTATQRSNGSGFQSGTLNQGDSFSHTFDEAGTYEYSCEFHGNMAGVVIVS